MVHRRAFLCCPSRFSGRPWVIAERPATREVRMAASWNDVNRFRLLTVVAISFLTSVSMAAGRERFTVWDCIGLVAHAGIAAFAYMQCPSDGKGRSS